VVASVSLIGAAFASACSTTDCADVGACAGPAAPAQDAGDAGPRVYPEVPPPPGCKPEADAKESPECMVDAYALFVDGVNGLDSNAGTKAAPLRTIPAAMNNDLLAGRPRVYVCADLDYTDEITVAPNVSVFGGFACETFRPILNKATRLAPKALTAFRIVDSTKGVVFSDLDIVASDGVAPGDSSIAVFVVSSVATFRRVKMTAGSGRDAPATDETGTNHGTVSNGQPGNGPAGGVSPTCTCPLHGKSFGGKGGDTGQKGENGTSEPLATQVAYNGQGGNGGPTCVAGSRGPAGAAGEGGRAAAAFGTLSAQGWLPASGTDGMPGQPGGGGGGGGGNTSVGGGSGACGGCGGAPGRGGKGGGSSVGIAMFESNVVVASGEIRLAKGGNGGPGGNGQIGQAGGQPAAATCLGGRGGAGSGGGGGAGGAGGLSVRILRHGGNVVVQDLKHSLTEITYGGGAGPAGAGGKSDGTEGNPGEQGPSKTLVSEDELLVP
jgi:hypothetical protein